MGIKLDKIRLRGDKIIWMVFILFMLISALEVYSTIGKTVYEVQGGSTSKMFAKHLIILLLGAGVMYAISHIKYTFFSRFSKIGFYLSIGLLLLTLALGSLSGKTAARWLVIPGIGQFQPSELVKIIVIVYVARLLALYQDKIKELDIFKKILIPVAIVSALIFPENFSTAALLFLVCYLMMFIGRVNMKYLGLVFASGVFFLIVAFIVFDKYPNLMPRAGTWVSRVEEFRETDKTVITQANLAKMAIATGGVTGKFLGNTEQARFLSESHNDFIFAIVIEEGGLLLGLIVIMLYLTLLYRGIQIARRSKGYFGAFAAIGLIMMIVIQALVNMFVATNIIPVTGQTLPFISYGGTSYLFSCIALGIVLSISSEAKKGEDIEQMQQDVSEESVNEEGNEEKIEENSEEVIQEQKAVN